MSATKPTPHLKPGHAIVRPPGRSFERAISSRSIAPDVRLALAEHAEYRQALAEAGLEVEVLPPDEAHPDSCFVQDPVLVISGQGIVARPGAPSRRGEEESLAAALEGRVPLARIRAPGTIEGGDVMALEGRVLVGESARTNRAGIEQLRDILAPHGIAVRGVPVGPYLHLLTGIAYLGHNMALAAAGMAGNPAFAGLEIIEVPDDEAYAANVLAVGARVIMPAGFPRVAAALGARGFEVLPVPMSQFAAADGGVTCLSLLW